MLQVAKDLLDAEEIQKKEERERYMEESCPPLVLPHSKDELQVVMEFTCASMCVDPFPIIYFIGNKLQRLEHCICIHNVLGILLILDVPWQKKCLI